MLTERTVANAWYHKTISQLFADNCKRLQDKPAIIHREETLSYAHLWVRVQRVAQGLIDTGVCRGDVVSLLPSPTVDFAILYFATLQIGAKVNPLNLLWGTDELRGVLQRNRPVLLAIVDKSGARDVAAWVNEALPELPTLKTKIYVGNGPAPAGFIDFSQFEDRSKPNAKLLDELIEQGKPTDIQFISQSSGTTGLSKSALWTHRTPLAAAHFAASRIRFSTDDRYINLAPFFHNSGMFALNLNLALAGSTLVLTDYFDPDEAMRLILDHHCTSTFGFDAHWHGLRQSCFFVKEDFPIKKALVAGDARTQLVVREMCGPEAALVTLYGQTECAGIVSIGEGDCMDEGLNRLTHGRPVPGVRVVIKDIDTGDLKPSGEPGEICYRSPYMFHAYLDQPEETKKSYDEEGYFHSGDYGALNDGYLVFMGRLGGVVKSGGENVSTVKVSTTLMEHFAEMFDHVQTVGIDDPYWGTKVIAFVRLKDGIVLPPTSDLREMCRKRMAAYEVPREFLTWEGPWPVSAEGKVDFKRLKMVASERLSSEPGVSKGE